MSDSSFSALARKTLGVIRLCMGTLALARPQLFVHRFSEGGQAAAYAFRLFGVRTIVMGGELLLLKGAELDRVARIAPLIHGSDTVAAFLAARHAQLPKRRGILLVAISAFNTVLSLIGRKS